MERLLSEDIRKLTDYAKKKQRTIKECCEFLGYDYSNGNHRLKVYYHLSQNKIEYKRDFSGRRSGTFYKLDKKSIEYIKKNKCTPSELKRVFNIDKSLSTIRTAMIREGLLWIVHLLKKMGIILW